MTTQATSSGASRPQWGRSRDLAAGPAFLKRRSALASLRRFCARKPLGAVGGFVVFVMILAAVMAPFVSPHGPYETNYANIRMAPSAKFLLGSDEFGRDVLSRLLYGAKTSLYVGLLAVGLGTTLGALIGLVGAFWGGHTDLASQRLIEVLMAFPMLVMALTIVAALGSSVNNVVIALAAVLIPQGARVIRANALAVKESQYVEAARAIGGDNLHIISQHVLPNCVAPYIIVATAGLGWTILVESSLSFLGLGVPEPSWGGMLSGAGRQFVTTAPWLAIFPGVALSLAVFGFNLLGDALRDVLDPRLRGT
ncbi:MAG: ABC transporter permease [Chloroflexi bacterium]|nr:ABC transporter permease [Chloroflexota bacterium]